jgi:hypothetical protein
VHKRQTRRLSCTSTPIDRTSCSRIVNWYGALVCVQVRSTYTTCTIVRYACDGVHRSTPSSRYSRTSVLAPSLRCPSISCLCRVNKCGAAFFCCPPSSGDVGSVYVADMLTRAHCTVIVEDADGEQVCAHVRAYTAAAQDDSISVRLLSSTSACTSRVCGAYVMSTSGSTGRPKMIRVSHASIGCNIDSIVFVSTVHAH